MPTLRFIRRNCRVRSRSNYNSCARSGSLPFLVWRDPSAFRLRRRSATSGHSRLNRPPPTMQGAERVEAWQGGGPLCFGKLLPDGGSAGGFRPFYVFRKDPAGRTTESDFLYPLLIHREDEVDHRWSLLSLVNFAGPKDPAAPGVRHFDVWPFYFSARHGRSGHLLPRRVSTPRHGHQPLRLRPHLVDALSALRPLRAPRSHHDHRALADRENHRRRRPSRFRAVAAVRLARQAGRLSRAILSLAAHLQKRGEAGGAPARGGTRRAAVLCARPAGRRPERDLPVAVLRLHAPHRALPLR